MADITQIQVDSTTYNIQDANAARSSHTHNASDVTNLGTMATVNDASANSKEYVRKNGAWVASEYLIDSGWKSISNSSVFSASFQYRKVGTHLIVRGYGKLVTDLSAKQHVTLVQLPAGYRPSYPMVGTCYVDTTSLNDRTLSVILYSSGDVELRSNNEQISKTYNLMFTISTMA